MSQQSTTTMSGIQKPFVSRLFESVQRRSNMLLDKSSPHIAIRWGVFAVLTLLYALRVYFLQGFYIVTYGLGIYLLNLFIGFLQPQDEMSINETQKDGPTLPMSGTDDPDDFRPFRRRVGEFKFWYSASKAVTISFFMTFFSIFDIPVFWPILLLYFIVLFALTMKRQIQHMIQHRYLPFSFGKPKFNEKTVEKKRPKAPMPKVRPPIRSMPMPQGLKKVNKD